MKKILFILTILIYPFTAMAQNQPQIPTNITKAVTDKFVPIMCHQGLKKAIEEVQKCYINTPAKYLQIEQCMVADAAVVMMVNINNYMKIKFNLIPEYTSSYITPKQYTARIEKYRQTILKYQKYNQQEFQNYIKKGAQPLISKIMLMIQSNNCRYATE